MTEKKKIKHQKGDGYGQIELAEAVPKNERQHFTDAVIVSLNRLLFLGH